MEQAAIATHNYSPPLTPVKKRKRADGKGYRRNSELTGSLHFGALRPRSRHADQETAKLKWEVLPDSLQDRVLELFETVEWPVIKQFQEDRKKTEAQVAVSSITRTLGKRLPRMLFPPNTKDVHFEYEALIEANRDSEQNLTSTLHSIALLNDEIAKEEKSLAIARADLAELQRNSRAELGLRHDKSSKGHIPLDLIGDKEKGDCPEKIGLISNASETPLILDGGWSSHLEPWMMQLQNHLDTISKNITQVTGIKNSLSRSSISLDGILYSKMESTPNIRAQAEEKSS